MMFDRCVWEKGYAGRPITPRRVAAARRHIQREKDKVALFPELVAETDPISRIEKFSAQEAANAIEWRNHRAAGWRRARRLLDAMPLMQRRGIVAYWERSWLQKEPVTLLTLIDQATRFHVSYWAKLREIHILKLVGAGKLPRELVFKANAGPTK